MPLLLTVLACLLTLTFLVVLAAMVHRITAALERIGSGGQSQLAMISWGVRAIEVETGQVPAQVPVLNAALAQVAAGLGQIDAGLGAIADAASRQAAYR